MISSTRSVLKKIFKHNLCNSVLEIGSGLQSTQFIYTKLSKLKKWNFTSIEHNNEWLLKVKQKIPFHKNFSLVKSDFFLNNNKFIYDFTSDLKFDLIFIDGPSKLDATQMHALDKILTNEKSIIVPTNKNGMQSLHMLEWSADFSHNNSIFILDGRLNSLIYYMENYKNYEYFHVGQPYSLDTIRSATKYDKYTNLTSTTIIIHKDSDIKTKIQEVYD
jgi:16S rRNA G966 N2-methylase RsmD